MFTTLVTYAAALLGPWVSTAAVVAVVTFVVFLAMSAWVSRCGFCAPKQAASGEPDSPARRAGRRAVASLKNRTIGIVDWVSRVLERISISAAILAIVGFVAVTLTTPAAAGAVAPLLDQAQSALRATAPGAFARIKDLGTPRVVTKDGSTVFTFHAAAAKGASAADYTVTVRPDGTVQVSEVR